MSQISGNLIVDIIILIFALVGAYVGFSNGPGITSVKSGVALLILVVSVIVFFVVLLGMAGISV